MSGSGQGMAQGGQMGQPGMMYPGGPGGFERQFNSPQYQMPLSAGSGTQPVNGGSTQPYALGNVNDPNSEASRMWDQLHPGEVRPGSAGYTPPPQGQFGGGGPNAAGVSSYGQPQPGVNYGQARPSMQGFDFAQFMQSPQGQGLMQQLMQRRGMGGMGGGMGRPPVTAGLLNRGNASGIGFTPYPQPQPTPGQMGITGPRPMTPVPQPPVLPPGLVTRAPRGY